MGRGTFTPTPKTQGRGSRCSNPITVRQYCTWNTWLSSSRIRQANDQEGDEEEPGAQGSRGKQSRKPELDQQHVCGSWRQEQSVWQKEGSQDVRLDERRPRRKRHQHAYKGNTRGWGQRTQRYSRNAVTSKSRHDNRGTKSVRYMARRQGKRPKHSTTRLGRRAGTRRARAQSPAASLYPLGCLESEIIERKGNKGGSGQQLKKEKKGPWEGGLL